MKELSYHELQELQELLDRPIHFHSGGWAELANEKDPQGTVFIKDRDGKLVMMMPREVYEDIRNWKP